VVGVRELDYPLDNFGIVQERVFGDGIGPAGTYSLPLAIGIKSTQAVIMKQAVDRQATGATEGLPIDGIRTVGAIEPTVKATGSFRAFGRCGRVDSTSIRSQEPNPTKLYLSRRLFRTKVQIMARLGNGKYWLNRAC